MKRSQFCHVEAANILNIHGVPNIWHIPLLLRNQNAHHSILKQLNLLRQSIWIEVLIVGSFDQFY
ncbi:hypothetical protein E1A91_D02G183400v1 [Gossypium mustelinum]|uniref:CTP synthase N-terminal domain-containing protein n=1 Tax=Gossypium mustelinum TaxID=34275 RepID=A0A5D2VXT9_GOSMU|nr:hypothetical protein E1A91_D02G183400v1 [Gossypium mustelinum]